MKSNHSRSSKLFVEGFYPIALYSSFFSIAYLFNVALLSHFYGPFFFFNCSLQHIMTDKRCGWRRTSANSVLWFTTSPCPIEDCTHYYVSHFRFNVDLRSDRFHAGKLFVITQFITVYFYSVSFRFRSISSLIWSPSHSHHITICHWFACSLHPLFSFCYPSISQTF